jgi:hypothetical protein
MHVAFPCGAAVTHHDALHVAVLGTPHAIVYPGQRLS